MSTIYFDSLQNDEDRRRALFDGRIFVYSPRRSTLDFIVFARGLIEEAFAPLDPEVAQFHMPVERYAEILSTLKPSLIHHPESKRHVANILGDLGADLEKTYFDLPKLRSATSNDFLTTGIAYAWHPHRDTWYSAPQCQVNWWIPLFDIGADNGMAFHPAYWNCGVANNSRDFNYYVWNKQSRGAHVARYLKSDPRPMPRSTEPLALDPQIRLVVPAGGIIVFSGAQMHSSVPNTSGKTRFSIDFRVVNRDDAIKRQGAPRVDEECTGTTMRDYLRCTDYQRLPEELVALYDDSTTDEGEIIYNPRLER